ncbi:BTB/POZ domain-containing protein KCTD11 [Ambystoma mexicanum]|uniref:BTB/POZ domain-containing protein KCTD11 n=1 Tax=Ambystoma mexicanum TaxID=8296 RepID=UPI0037E8FA08
MLDLDLAKTRMGFGGPVTLNVGGKRYSTTLETLTRFPDSMLGAMFLRPWPSRKDADGAFFIDRDGKVFRHVLNFLRFDRLDLPEGYRELALLEREADFYQIRPLLEEIRRRREEERATAANAILHVDVECNERLLHFTLRKGPQNYDLSTCHIQAFTANLFCTDSGFLRLIGDRLLCGTSEDTPSLRPEEARDHHMRLEWAPRPDNLPTPEYLKQNLRPLLSVPEARELTCTSAFLEEVLKTALSQGFRIDAIFPDPEDILNSRSLRFVRH